MPDELAEIRREVWSALGPDAQARYEAFGAACQPLTVDLPHLHLNMIGVGRTGRGLGLARRLLERLHDISRNDPASKGVTLTTEDPANLPFYRRFRYDIVGHAVVAPDLETWGFFRPNE